MKVNLDRWRILHLIALILVSHVLAQALMHKYGWPRLSAYGFAVTVATQMSNAMHPPDHPAESKQNAAETRRQEKRAQVVRERALRKGDAGAAKKRKHNARGTDAVAPREE